MSRPTLLPVDAEAISHSQLRYATYRLICKGHTPGQISRAWLRVFGVALAPEAIDNWKRSAYLGPLFRSVNKFDAPKNK